MTRATNDISCNNAAFIPLTPLPVVLIVTARAKDNANRPSTIGYIMSVLNKRLHHFLKYCSVLGRQYKAKAIGDVITRNITKPCRRRTVIKIPIKARNVGSKINNKINCMAAPARAATAQIEAAPPAKNKPLEIPEKVI